MEKSIFQSAGQISQLQQKAYDVYLPLVDDLCRQEVSEDELSYVLDYLLDFACNEKMLELYKRVCRSYCTYIRVASNFMLKRIERCGKMKTNDCSAGYF